MIPWWFGLMIVLGNTIVAFKIADDHEVEIPTRMCCPVGVVVGTFIVFYGIIFERSLAWLEFVGQWGANVK